MSRPIKWIILILLILAAILAVDRLNGDFANEARIFLRNVARRLF